ncbi:MAG TPA: LamG-like jellyroll fold domain-containing protein [Baekduia sp.]|nr:LamG-like jellyroll fold domain-containing protein [Baekduia sp.]
MAAVVVALAAPAAANAGVFGSAGPFDGAATQPLKINDSLVAAAAIPSGFIEDTVWSGLIAPSNLRFAADGSAYVAQLDGVIEKFESLTDPTPTTVVDLSSQVAFFGDRGLIGMALDPQFTTGRPYIYVLYTYDAKIGGTAPLWNDNCPNPPGADIKGCVVSGRLSRINANTGAETVLIKDEWCQQYSSHSVGDLQFGPDGALYASAGDGASFTFADYGQDGQPVNPCGDPPGGVGGAMSPPTAEGGALRSQDARTSADPTGLDGAIIRVDPDTGAPLPDNPGTGDTNAKRVIAYGMRNPFRFAFRPGTTDLYFGDVGWNSWEELNRIPNPTQVRNYGWPCYEGTGRMSSYDNLNLNICENLYSSGSVTAPLFTYGHGSTVADESVCSPGTSSTSGIAFNNGTSFPAAYNGALFFADYARGCIWSMFAGAGGVPDPATRQVLVDGADTPVDLQTGPDGALYYVSVGSGSIHRISAVNANKAPTAHATASPTSGTVPLMVNFDGTGSTDPNNDTLTYSWDLDGDGTYGDSTAAKPSFTYTIEGSYTVRLKVADPGGATSTAQLTVTAGVPPTATIAAPATGQSYAVSDLINFSGSAVDGHGAAMAASRLTWQIELHHCSAIVPGSCHVHNLQTYNGVASGSYTYPDHEYPSYLTLVLTATDASGLADTRSVRIDPKTVELTFTSSPSGLPISVGAEESMTPFTRTVVQNGTVAVIAPTPQILGGTSYDFTSWSNGGAAVHQFTAPTAATTYTATYTASPCPTYTGLVGQWGFDEASGTTATDGTGNGLNGSITGAVRSSTGKFGGALSFNGTSDVVSVADNAKLDLTTGMTLEGWVNPTTLAGSWRTVGIKENTGALVYALYATNNTNMPSGHVSTPAESDTRGTGTVPLNAWTHLATTYDGATLKMYVNGTLASSKAVTGSMPNSAGALRFGGNNVWGEYFSGRLDELRLYSRALTQAQIQSDMTAPVTCSGAPPAPVLSTSPASLSFSATSGAADPASKTINVTNTGGGTLSYTVGDDQPWLSASPVSGSAPGTITVSASVSGLAAGTYTANVTVTASGANGSPKTIPVTLTVAAAPAAPTLTTSPSSLAFSGVSGAADPGSKTIDVTNTGGSTLSYTVAKDQPWLTVSPAGGTAPGTITVNASLNSLAAGTYTGNVTVTASGASGSPKTIPVTFTVAAPPALGVTPSTLAFTAMQGGANPAPQTVDVSNTGGGTLTYTVTKDQSWLTVTPTSGTAPSTLTVGANSAGLAPGSYTGTVAVSAPGAGGSPKTVSVALTINAAPPAPSGLVGAWGFDETSGTGVTDASGNGLNGTLTGATRTTTGKFGGALSFNGTSNWVTVADNAKLDLTTKITMEGWVNPTALGSTWRTVMIKEGASSLVYSLYASEGTSKASGHVFTSTEFDTRSTAGVALNTWTYLATTWDGATLRLYVNGTLVSSKPVTGTMPNSSGALRFGGNSVWGEWFRGQLDEIRVYNRALAQSEIQADMTTPVSGAGLRVAVASAKKAKKDVKKAAKQRKSGSKPSKGTAHRKAQAPKAKYPGKHRRPR